MPKFFIYFIVLSISSYSFGAEENFCANTNGLNDIKAYFTCQSKTGAASCAALGAGVLGKALSVKAVKQYAQHMRSMQAKLVDDMASHLHEEWRAPRSMSKAQADAKLKELDDIFRRAGEDARDDAMMRRGREATEHSRKAARDAHNELKAMERAIKNAPKNGGKIFEPRLKDVDGKIFDIANLKYADLPDKFQFENKESARVTVQNIMNHLQKGGSLDDAFVEKASSNLHDEWLKRNGSWAPAEQKLPFNQLSQAEADKDRVMIRKGIQMFDEQAARVAAQSGAFGAAFKAIAKAGPKSLLALGGIVGAGVYAAGEILGASTAACATADRMYVNSTGDGGCGEELAIDDTVARFLMQPEAEQARVLNDIPAVCDFYKKLHAKFFDLPKLTKLTCSGKRRFEFEAKASDGAKLKHRVVTFNDGTIRQINVHRNNTNAGVFQFNSSGEYTSGARAPKHAARLQSVKMYIGDIASCCQSGSDSAQSKCISDYNTEAIESNSTGAGVRTSN